MSDNAEQIEYWNGTAGENWVTAQERLDTMLEPLSAQALDAAAPQPGERVVDIGCGCGATSIAIAERGASVWGVDISAPMLAHAVERASGMDNVQFSESDAASAAFTPDHQLVFSRFGVMFFSNPLAAFSNIRSALAPGGRLAFLCWQAPTQNPWIAVAARAIQPYLPEPVETPDPRAPGPFAFADADYVLDLLGGAGFAELRCEPVTATLTVGETLEDAMTFQGRIGPVSQVLAELDDAARDEALNAARAALEPFAGPQGVRLESACWMVHGRQAA